MEGTLFACVVIAGDILAGFGPVPNELFARMIAIMLEGEAPSSADHAEMWSLDVLRSAPGSRVASTIAC